MSKQILLSFALFQPNDRETKFFVAGLLWITRTESLISYFERFGVIVNANVVCDGATQRSKRFGFVTFREAESATRACENPNHVIDGRTVNCKIAYLGARIHNNQPNQYGF
ncbi:RNA recognition motif domain [Arabidopsis suecica]|uniref:RNA recognition motif domain n=1 Tax=Arabidopsis suecica TaxID=45249 RepID=A0A8T1Y3T4_ARASU|nr:RNA recognition motif domain [Arabidopsis suecica]